MENKIIKLQGKRALKRRQGFALLLSIFLVVLVSILSYRIIENNIFLSNLNKLKYLHLQAVIYMDKTKKFIKEHTSAQIALYHLDDSRFDLQITQKDEDSKEVYYIVLQTTDGSPIRLSEKIIK